MVMVYEIYQCRAEAAGPNAEVALEGGDHFIWLMPYKWANTAKIVTVVIAVFSTQALLFTYKDYYFSIICSHTSIKA